MPCTRQTSKKYTSRNSPPYPGTACCHQVKYGNDNKLYKSRPAKGGNCRWSLLVKSRRRKSSSPSRKTGRKSRR